MNDLEGTSSGSEKPLEERATEFALNNAGELEEGMDPKRYWDDYYNFYYQYLDVEKLLDRFDEEEKTKEYEFFKWQEARNDIFEFSKSIAEYLKNEDVQNLVIVDRSSRPLYIGVKEYWKDAYHGLPMPNIYFVNPKGFKNTDEVNPYALEYTNLDGSLKGDKYESIDKARTKDEVMEEFENVYPKLIKDKEKPILVFDTCIHSGNTLLPFTSTLEELGFTDVRIGSVNPSEEGSSIETDFFITRRSPEKGCYPFDRDRMIEKTFEHVYSQPTKDLQKRRAGNQLREEIKRIMQERLNKEN